MAATGARKFDAYRQTIGNHVLIDHATVEGSVALLCDGYTAYKTHVDTLQVSSTLSHLTIRMCCRA